MIGMVITSHQLITLGNAILSDLLFNFINVKARLSS